MGYSAFDISLRIEFEKPGLVGHHSGLVVAIPLMLFQDGEAILDCNLAEPLLTGAPNCWCVGEIYFCHAINENVR